MMRVNDFCATAALAFAVFVSTAHAVSSDGAFFNDSFSGAAFDTTKWNPTLDPATPDANHYINVEGSGTGRIVSSFGELDAFMRTQPGQLNRGTSTASVVELRFSVGATAAGTDLSNSTPREAILIAGEVPTDFWVTLLNGSTAGTFSLGWGGFGSPSSAVSPLDPENGTTTDLDRGTFYTLALSKRTDNEVDIYRGVGHVPAVPDERDGGVRLLSTSLARSRHSLQILYRDHDDPARHHDDSQLCIDGRASPAGRLHWADCARFVRRVRHVPSSTVHARHPPCAG